MKTSVKFETIFPLTTAPLIQCITNEITCESMANALLYIDAKPIIRRFLHRFRLCRLFPRF